MANPALAVQGGPAGYLAAGDPDGEVLAFIGSVFDHPGRPGLARDLPLSGDRLYAWRSEAGEIQGAMLARSWVTRNGTLGANLGFICTDPDHRREGLGRAMVSGAVIAEDARGAQFTMLWARDHLLKFYQWLGFTSLATEEYLEVPVSSSVGEYGFAPLAEVPHAGFEALRAAHSACLPRLVENNHWTGANTGFPWAGGLYALWGGTPEAPDWYAAVAPANSSATLMEYAGPASRFNGALAATGQHFGLSQVRLNTTDPEMADRIQPHGAASLGAPFHRLLRANGLDLNEAPQTTWLDRI